MSRLAYTWVAVCYLSIGFYLFAIGTYQLVGRSVIGELSWFTDVTNHVLFTRSLSWMLMFFVPIFSMIIDVVAKVFSNMFYPTQTQIHLEMESMAKMEGRQRRFAETGRYSRTRDERRVADAMHD
jgi:flagellar biosynthesis protein FlhB